MGLRPGRCYRSLKDRAYTRVALKVHRKNFIGATPGLRTRQFNMGNPLQKYDTILDLFAEESVQIRDNSIESARLAINRALVKKIGKDNFFMRIRIYPHQILRENKMATGAGADRVSQGMGNCPFGKPIGRAARVKGGQKIISVLVKKEHLTEAKKALEKAAARITSKISVRAGTDIESIGTLPKKVREIVEEKKEEKEGEEEEEKKEGEKKEGREEEKGGKKEEKPKEMEKNEGKKK